MSVDTRTPRGHSMHEPELSMVKVPCDPAQVIVNHASFRVQLATPPPVSLAVAQPPRLSRVPATARRRPLVWTGRSAPGDPGASTLVQAVRNAGRVDIPTQVLPRVTPVVAAPRAPQDDRATRLLPSVGGPRGAAEAAGPGAGGAAAPAGPKTAQAAGHGAPAEPERRRTRQADGRQAYYPGRRASRLSLGVVLLPLRVLLGFIALYAGMGKLTDPVYFDGGDRGSLYAWLASLEPWSVATPLHDWALAHPVGAGLTVAFTQILVGVLTVFGLWQRPAASLGALLSLALLATVSWQQGPAYDTPDIILLAAWSPLVIAGAPVYSLDARLAGEAWRTLGPKATLGELRRRVLRRGGLLAALLGGLALLVGAMLGGAVRSAQFPEVPGPGEPPRNHLPGERLPGEEEPGEGEAEATRGPGEQERREAGGESAGREEASGKEGTAPAGPEEGGAAGETAGPETAPSVEQTVPAPPRSEAPARQPAPEEAPPASDSGGAGASEPGPGSEDAEDDAPSDDGGEQSSPGPIGGLLG
ncbi:DoxX family membrane protein [Streptomyces hoynatensis]|uniref:DoxX family membrane protein n=1 Tax=Streptomyces hoynatensis TaxID=1141874 RepID=A0A3A9Z0F5_9ACTN|nr:DoxX family membrane protein [Streptomyces hoynatensis]RKN41773.1 DoxX family membrane protein [Streptomyces hoynatensis]